MNEKNICKITIKSFGNKTAINVMFFNEIFVRRKTLLARKPLASLFQKVSIGGPPPLNAQLRP